MGIIELKDVHKVYPLGKVEVPAVKGVTFSIEKGDFVSIAGPSGAGKSTILNMIGLIDTPTSGEVIIDGKPTSGLSDKELTRFRHEVLGFVFQSLSLSNPNSVTLGRLSRSLTDSIPSKSDPER